MLSELTAAPRHISPEEHAALTSSTPASFDDIPPVLRWTSGQVEVVLEPAQPFWHGRKSGTLWVTDESVAFLPADGTPGFNLPFPSLSLHALSPASAELGTAAHIYCQIDESDATPQAAAAATGEMNGGASGSDEDGQADGGDEEYAEMREMRIFVAPEQLEKLFSELSASSALHDSLLPSGEPSSFGFFPDDIDNDDDDDYDDEDAHDGEPNGDDGGEQGAGRVDQVERFRDLIDWGNVPKPAGWDNDDVEEDVYADADARDKAV